MKKAMRYISHFFMNIGMLAERLWDETKKFIWWLFAPNAYADLYHDYKTLQTGYKELYDQWNNETAELYEIIDQLKAELEKLKQA